MPTMEIEAKNNKYNWGIIKREYVEGYFIDDNVIKWPTMKELALKWGVPPNYLRRVASEDRWTVEKRNYVTNYEHAKQEEKIRYLAKKSAKFDTRCAKIAEEGIRRIENYLIQTENNVIIDKEGNPVKIIVTLQDLEMAAKTLEKFQKIGRLAFGNTTDNKREIKDINVITMHEGLDITMKQIESNPSLKDSIEEEFIDR